MRAGCVLGKPISGRRRFLAGLSAVGFGGTFSASGLLIALDEPNGGKPVYTPAVQRAVEKGLQFLAARQNDDGSFGTGGYARNVAVCGLCGMAFIASGNLPGRGRFGQPVTRCTDFVLGSAQESGLLNVPEGTERGPMYGHGFATLFLAEVYGTRDVPELRAKLGRAVRLIIKTQNPEGGWRYEPRPDEADISVTVCQVMALRAARNAGIHVPSYTMDRAVEYVKRCQNQDGGFSYMLGPGQRGDSRFPRSAAAVVALYSAGVYDSDEVRRGLKYLQEFPPQASSLSEQSYFLYGHYYASQAMWHAGGATWENWYPAIRDWLIARQRPTGEWVDPISPEYGTAMACLILQMPRNYLPIFQR